MTEVFPEAIRNLPEADIPLEGVEAYLSLGEDHQIIFIHFHQDVEVPEHAHGVQWEIVLDGKVEVWMEGKHKLFAKGDKFCIEEGTKHSATVHAGYTAMIFFDQRDRYKVKAK